MAHNSNYNSFQSIFDEIVCKHSDKRAVSYMDTYITYRELNEKANRLAFYLTKIGIEAEDRVAIICERTIETITAIIAVLKSGGAYVPIDSTLPIERKKFIIKDSMAKAVLVGNMDLDQLHITVPIINIMSKVNDTENYAVIKQSSPKDLAVIFYTSGTTGTPKGVMVEHKRILNNIINNRQNLKITNKDVVLQLASPSFMVLLDEISMSLLLGGELCLIPYNIILDTKKFEQYIYDHGISVALMSPRYVLNFNRLKIKTLFVMGGMSPIDILQHLDESTQYYNGYGTTEAGFAMAWRAPDNYKGEIIPIGIPKYDANIYIVNENRLCSVMEKGEICVESGRVARGYLSLPELTAEKFVKNPFGTGIMYRTGDIGRWLPDGNIECLGRMDDQVEIRGYRIELGEIENVIKKQPSVKDCAVIAKENAEKEKVIYAFVTGSDDLNTILLRKSLYDFLPEYMIPLYITKLGTIPVNKNGKVNKNELSEIDVTKEYSRVEIKNPTETLIANAFCQVLHLDKIGLDEDFFQIGGHSLRAVHLINLIESNTGLRLPMGIFFNHPTIRQISEYIDKSPVGTYEPIPKAELKEYYAMSQAQKRIYVIYQIEKEGKAYNIPQGLELKGNIQVERLKEAVERLIRRHEILRTEFMIIEGELVQRISEDAELEFAYFEEMSETENEILQRFVRPFDLGKAPLVRVEVVKRKDKHLLLMDMHHIIGDGMSMGTFIRELCALYNGERLDGDVGQYKDYSEWMHTRDLSPQRNFWVDVFSDEIPVLDMPLDYVRPKEQSFEGARIHYTVGKETFLKIKDLSQKYEVTKYMILLSAAMVTLSKYSRQEDIVIGTPVSGRLHRDTENMLGMFVNTLAMRGRPEGRKRYMDFLQEIKETCLKGYENQEYPFEELVEAVGIRRDNVPRDMGRNPLFDVMLVLQNDEEARYELKGIDVAPIEVENKSAKFDLTFEIVEYDEEFRVGLEYCTALYKAESARGILEHYGKVLEQITEKPESLLEDLEITTEEEGRLILDKFNNTKANYPQDKTVVELFEEQAERTPENVALVFEGEELTYRELNVRANQLALRLREYGVARDKMVALIAERSIEMIIGIYGILKAGGAYVPIDPGYPQERIEYMLEDCKPKALLVYSKTGTQIEARIETKIPVIDLSQSQFFTGPSENPARVNSPEDLVYCIYTSGTTGKPKGVPNIHKGLINRIMWMNREYPIGCKDVILQKTTYTFDVSVWEIFWWSFTGARLVLLEVSGEKEPNKICGAIENYGVTTLHFVPSMFKMFVEYLERFPNELKRVQSIRNIFASGEALTGQQVNRFYEVSATCGMRANLINCYGPTEASIDVTYYHCQPGDRIIPIGRPISNTQIYILSKEMLCGIGIPGELCIAGDGLARGYLNKRSLTAEKFINNPFGVGRLYRTGDLARWMPDGNIEYLGRIDDQVKIRGFRIELLEIASKLHEIDGIKDAVVITREDSSGDKAIYAYVVSDEPVSINGIREQLGKSLPDYMIPGYMMQLEKIPITGNGKLDRKALPAIEARSEKEYAAPRDEIETLLCRIYEEVLRIRRVGVKDSFFALGGHSLKAVQVMNKIEVELGMRLPLKTLFSHDTVEELRNQLNIGDKTYVPIPKAEEKEYYPMSSTQKRTYVIRQIEGNGTAYNMPQCLKLKGNVQVDRIKEAVVELIRRHEILRTEFRIIEGGLVQRVLEEAELEFLYLEERSKPEEEIFLEFVRPFDLEKAPLVRVEVVKRMEEEHSRSEFLLFIDMHHIVSDGISMGTFIHELCSIYNGGQLEGEVRQYKDYSEWMRIRDLSSQQAYWTKEFSDEIPVLEMPLDYNRPKEQSFEGAMLKGSLEKELYLKIKDLSKKSGATNYMILLSAAMITLSKYSRQEDIVIGSPASARLHKDTEKMLGMFVNTLAMRGIPAGKKRYIDFLQEIKEMCIKAFENQEYPFEELLKTVDAERDIGRNPLFDVMLTLQNNEKARYELKDIQVDFIELESKIAKFDLTFDLYENEEGIDIRLEYCTALYKAESAKGIMEHYLQVLEEITERPEDILEDIDMSTEEERRLIMEVFNGAKAK